MEREEDGRPTALSGTVEPEAGPRGDPAWEGDLAALLGCIDGARARDRTSLLRRCIEVAVPPERVWRAFARRARFDPWIDATPLGAALRDIFAFAQVDASLQAAGARPERHRPPGYVACCGCARPWCRGKPCATGWVRPLDERERLRMAAWRWAERERRLHFGGFYEQELARCTEPDAGNMVPYGGEGERRLIAYGGDERPREGLVLSATPRHVALMRHAAFYAATTAAMGRAPPLLSHPTEPAIVGATASDRLGLHGWASPSGTGDAFVVHALVRPEDGSDDGGAVMPLSCAR
jgi:hypothetical protein